MPSFRCQFAHGKAELRTPATFNPNYKKVPCRNFHTTGYCSYQTRCEYLHDETPEQVEVLRAGGTLRAPSRQKDDDAVAADGGRDSDSVEIIAKPEDANGGAAAAQHRAADEPESPEDAYGKRPRYDPSSYR